MAVVAAIATAAAIAGAVSSIQQGRAAAKVGRQNAQLALARSALEESRFQREGKRQLARIRASIATRGITVEGSPLALLADQAAEIEENAALIRLGGGIEAAQARTRGDFARSASFGQAISLFGSAAGSAVEGLSLLDGGGAQT